MNESFRVGAGRAVVRLTEDCFPSEGFHGVHDDLQARVLLFEEWGVRSAILSAELTSMFPHTIRECREILRTRAGVPADRCWITVTHTFSSPHLWPTASPDNPAPQPTPPDSSPEAAERYERIGAAWHTAFTEAVDRAVAGLREARVGFGIGRCGVNANRNVETADGWWLGCDADGDTDHSVHVMTFDALDGTPIGLIFVYACQSSIMDQSTLPDGGRLVTGDLAGAASAHVERDFGGDYVAMFLCGAAGDQTPQLRARTNWVDRTGALQTLDRGHAGFTLVDAQGLRLGEEVVRTAVRINRNACQAATDGMAVGQDTAIDAAAAGSGMAIDAAAAGSGMAIDAAAAGSGTAIDAAAPGSGTASASPQGMLAAARREFDCPAKKMARDMRTLKPVRSIEWEPDGMKPMEVECLRIGRCALVGVRPEIGARTGIEIREGSPFDWTAVVTMVNGGAKYMSSAEDYDRITYGAMNSPFQRGSAEQLRDEAAKLLASMC